MAQPLLYYAFPLFLVLLVVELAFVCCPRRARREGRDARGERPAGSTLTARPLRAQRDTLPA